MSETETIKWPRICLVEERDLLTWRSLTPLAVGLGVTFWFAWANLPVGVFRDLLLLTPALLPLLLYKRLRGWNAALGFGLLAGLASGCTRHTWLGIWSRWTGTSRERYGAAFETLIIAAIVGPTSLLMWVLGRIVFGRLIVSDGKPRCFHCGYCLIGIEANRCPECGSLITTPVAAAPT